MRPILMTSAAMIAGMIPMALAFGEGAEATAPLGRAVIGGLAAATVATLIVLPSVYALVQHSARQRVAVARSRRSGERLSGAGADMQCAKPDRSCASPSWLVVACWRGDRVRAQRTGQRQLQPAPAGLADRSRWSTSSSSRSNVTLSLPGELTPYETVAVYPRVTGFVKTIRVDRGSRVRAGELMAVLEAPELVAQRAEAQSKLQARGSAARGRAIEGRRRRRAPTTS